MTLQISSKITGLHISETIDSNIAYVAPGQADDTDSNIKNVAPGQIQQAKKGKNIYPIISQLRKRARVRHGAATREMLKRLIPPNLMVKREYHAASLKDIFFIGQDYM